MNDIYKYLEIYGKKDFTEARWNDIDSLVCSILSYVPIKSFEGFKTLEEINKLCKNSNVDKNFFLKETLRILDLVANCKRYKKMKVFNASIINNTMTQFGAFTFRVGIYTIIAFKGTDGAVIGWLENFRLSYQYPTITQELAINYLNDNIKFFDNKVYVVGHSKGGNLAMVSCMELSSFKFKKVAKILNYDGPGFRKEEFESSEYVRIKDKITTYVPTNSSVGMILRNEKFTPIKSYKKGVKEHYPFSWEIYGQYFVDSKLSQVSKRINKMTTVSFEKIGEDKLRDVFENIFANSGKKYDSKFKFNYESLNSVRRGIKSVDPEVKKTLELLFKEVFKLIKKDKDA